MWLDPKVGSEFEVAIGAKVFNSNSNQIQVVDDEGKVIFRRTKLFKEA